jgi:hypothetical protein
MSPTPRLIACTLALTLCTGYALAQTALTPDTLKVDYFSNAHSSDPDGTVRITNAGTSGGNLCAAIFVYDALQELTECCSCAVTPNGLQTLSVDKNLLDNPLNGISPTTGSIRIVSTTPVGGVCPLPVTGKITPTAGLRAWATHIQSSSRITETASQDATLSSAELGLLEADCRAVALVGSKQGICTCGTGD